MKELLVICLVFSGFFSFAIGIYALIKKEVKSALPFAMLMIACGIHALGYGFELFLNSEANVLFWVRVEYVGISFYPFLLAWIVYNQKNDESFRSSFTMLIFFSMSLTTFFLMQSNDLHHLYYKSIEVNFTQTINQVIFVKGPWYHVHTFITLIAFVYISFHMVTLFFKSEGIYKRKALNAILALGIPFLASLLYLVGLTPKGLDILPYTYAFVGLIWLLGAKTYGTGDLVPVTYKKIFEQISEGVVVLDENNRVVNFNSAAYKIFLPLHCISRGCNFDEIFQRLNIKNRSDEGEFFEIFDLNKTLKYHLKRSILNNKSHKQLGNILVFNDITKEAEAKEILTKFANQDALTGIHNRRYFFDLCENKLEFARKCCQKVSFVLMDIDFFKEVNDTYGHFAGDTVLKELSMICEKVLREDDLVGRYGGEEFAILIYNSSLDETYKIIERLRKSINEHQFFIDKQNYVHVTASFGIVHPDLTIESNLQDIFKKADKGLYQAKEQGRDCIVLYSEVSS